MSGKFQALVLIVCLLALSSSPSQSENLADDGKPIVNFGVIPRYNPMIMYRNYQPIMDYLTEHTSYRFELKLSRDYTEAVKFMRTGVTPIASLGDVTFIESRRPFLQKSNSPRCAARASSVSASARPVPYSQPVKMVVYLFSSRGFALLAAAARPSVASRGSA